ncbi:MAG: hypothetical protein HC794_07460 [Nitrospiraceae bacterium]|nr:hypothetical protein [Nitrospiraceae bacterium]
MQAGIYIGLFLVVLFLGIHARRKSVPKFSEAVMIVLGTVGVVIGLDFGYLVLALKDQLIEPLADHRVRMLLGAMAVVWTSCESLVGIARPLWRPNAKRYSLPTEIEETLLNPRTADDRNRSERDSAAEF